MEKKGRGECVGVGDKQTWTMDGGLQEYFAC